MILEIRRFGFQLEINQITKSPCEPVGMLIIYKHSQRRSICFRGIFLPNKSVKIYSAILLQESNWIFREILHIHKSDIYK